MEKVIYLAERRQIAAHTEVAAFFRLGEGEARFKLIGIGRSAQDRLDMAEAFEAAARTLREQCKD